MREACAPAELFPDIPTVQTDVTLALLTAELSPLIEDIAEQLTPRVLRYQCALWVL